MKKLFSRDELSQLHDHLQQADDSLKHAHAKLDAYLVKMHGVNGLVEHHALMAAVRVSKGREHVRVAQALMAREVTARDSGGEK